MMSSIYVKLTDNYKFRRFILGYGISYAKNIWDHRYYDNFDAEPPVREPNNTLSRNPIFFNFIYIFFIKVVLLYYLVSLLNF